MDTTKSKNLAFTHCNMKLLRGSDLRRAGLWNALLSDEDEEELTETGDEREVIISPRAEKEDHAGLFDDYYDDCDISQVEIPSDGITTSTINSMVTHSGRAPQ